ncbi:Myc-type, basic helix-loop-helix (bHLH) domain [Dillenia turbinata]|uniref:Myc-type, basic helix-loop-helix (BHLH) domain n=1 Tax=Dillenia turbinata TaxID=194707 RepID=A0AAN8Z2C2_9MAGN
MELSEHSLLDELLALRRDTWNTYPTGVSELLPNNWSFDSFEENSMWAIPNPSIFGFNSAQPEPSFSSHLNQVYPFVDEFIVPGFGSSYNKNSSDDTTPIPIQEDYPAMLEDEELNHPSDDLHSLEGKMNSCKVETEQAATEAPVFNMGLCSERKSRAKKVEGQPSKNLMAERRRRKRLNDRLLMLRSIVPKISKMDRTSILGDTIDYMKELLERINNLQREETKVGFIESDSIGILKDQKPNEVLVRNTPKFEVERRNADTRINICCAGKPGLLLSTVNTLEALGLEIQQCVISCFNDFSAQASCSEEAEQRCLINSEDIKQALFRNAGYGGRCL